MPPSKSPDLKSRVNTCINKLSDRDTLTMATNELDSIARALFSGEDFAVFITAVSATDSSEKSAVRRHCVRSLSVLAAAHGDSLSPHLSKMISAVVRRLRDGDSVVRAACVEAIAGISRHVTSPPFSSITKPLFDSLFGEQDYNVQIGAALCLAAGVDSSPEPEPSELKRHVPKLLKLVKSDSFKAKPALIALIGSIAGAGGCSGRTVLSNLIPVLVEFLSSSEWAARKASAEALGRLAVEEGDFLSEFKSSCLASIESKRFDKVKCVRETMNNAIKMWREISRASDDVSNDAESMSSLKDNGGDDIGYVTPQQKRVVSRIRSPASSRSSLTDSRSPLRTDLKKPKASRSLQVATRKSSQKVENSDSDSVNSGSCEGFKVPFNKSSEERESRKEFENLSLIQKQLLQIENQQSSLMDLLQKFIGHSQNGMNSLEQRVDGLEKVLDEMSHLALTTSNSPSPNADETGNACCIHADFLSPKFWRKAEGGPFGSYNKVATFTPKKHQVGIMPEMEFPEYMQSQAGQFWDHSQKRVVS